MLTGFAQRAAVAHAVYSPEVRRPVEVGADQEQQLVTWLSKRLGTPVQGTGAEARSATSSIGGRLLARRERAGRAVHVPATAPASGSPLYVTREPAEGDDGAPAAFQLRRATGSVNVFYWVDKDFGYALSAPADRAGADAASSHEVYRQLGGR